MIKVGFWFDAPFEYSGGLNYIKNLLHALAQVNDGTVKPYVFFSTDLPHTIESQLSIYATIVKTRLLKRRTVLWFIHKALDRVFGVMPLFKALLKLHGIDVLSHVWFKCQGTMPCRIISWIPDFQYLHLPDMFPRLDAEQETRTWQQVIAQSDLVVLSSDNAYQDFKRIAPSSHHSRARVLRFVSQPGARTPNGNDLDMIKRKYRFNGRYFHLPNQFWNHKNHLVVLQAVDRLKRLGVEVQVLCTGNQKDYRQTGEQCIDNLREFINSNGLGENVKLLGLIDYDEVLLMMRNSVAVLNPSRFEGWSSSVEEAKSMGLPVILSRIGTHIEQQPASGSYFDPDNAEELAEILQRLWTSPDQANRAKLESSAATVLQERTLAFGREYLGILKSVTDQSNIPDFSAE